MRKAVIFLFLTSCLFCLPIFLHVSSTFPRLDTDYNAVLPVYDYIRSYLILFHKLPLMIPFIGTGAPLIGDPVNGIFDPVFSLPLILFGINLGIRIAIVINAFLSGIAMFVLLTNLKVKKNIVFAGSLLYLSSGGFVASVAAGHITEKFLTFPLIPLFFLFLLREKLTFKNTIIFGIIIGLSIYCGDIYMLWFFTLFLFLGRGYWLLVKPDKRNEFISIFTVLLTVMLFISPKVYFFVKDILPILKRTGIVNPFLGSIQIIYVPLQFLMPLQVNFFDRPFLQKHIIHFYYNWYEYYGFTGLFAAFFLKNIKKISSRKEVQLLFICLLMGGLYIANAYWYSPFHYLFLFFKPFDVFRVPQRMVIPLITVVVVLICLCAQTWKNRKTFIILFVLSVAWTISIGWYTFSYTFVPIPPSEISFVDKVASIDKTRISIVDVSKIPQYLLLKKGIGVDNYYYAWFPKNTPDYQLADGTLNLKTIVKNKPKFILSTDTIHLQSLGYKNIYISGNSVLWTYEAR